MKSGLAPKGSRPWEPRGARLKPRTMHVETGVEISWDGGSIPPASTSTRSPSGDLAQCKQPGATETKDGIADSAASRPRGVQAAAVSAAGLPPSLKLRGTLRSSASFCERRGRRRARPARLLIAFSVRLQRPMRPG